MRFFLNKYFLVFIFVLNGALISFSQGMANYTVTRATSITYTSISSSGSSFASWRNAAPGTSQDDNRSAFTNIGFDFWYNGIRYAQFAVSTNGFIDFSSSTADGTGTGAYGYSNVAYYGNGSGTWLSLAPIYDDFTAQGGTGALGNSVKYIVSGSAPNRVLTVEWINMAVFGNTTPDLNFQVKLYETTGVIEYWYGTMTPGTATYSYTSGINAASLANAPTTAELKCQQTANTTTFNNGEVGNLSTLPASSSKITFTPPVTTGSPSGSVTFTGVTSTGMTLNWTNWCTNEIGYAIYSSTDGTNYSYVSQTAANSTTYAATSLLPSTLYYWRVFAVKEGYVSTAVSGSQSTSASGAKTSNVASGNWNTAGSWTPSGVPTAGDNVTIANGHTITIDVAAVCNNLTVGQGTSGILSIGNNGTPRTITVNSNLIISNGASFITNAASDATHLLTLGGNITNSGILNFRTDALSICNTTFVKNGSQTVSGTGATMSFNLITANMGSSVSNILEFTSTNFSAPSNFLTLTMGTFKLSTTAAVNVTPYSGLATLTGNNAFFVNSSTATVNFAGGINLHGNLSIANGTLNIGDAADENIQSFGGTFQIAGGTTTIAGRYFTPDINNAAFFSMSSGTLTLVSVGSTSTSLAPFNINSPGSTFTMSNGTIVIQREGGTGAQDLGFLMSGLTSNSITGGVLQFGNGSTPASQIINYSSAYNIGGITVNSANATARLMQHSTVLNNVTISSGILNANNFNLSLGGNWSNNATFTAGTGTLTFNGSAAQTLLGSATNVFTNLTISNTSGVSITSGTYTLSDVLTLSNGTFASGGNSFTLLSTASKTARIASVAGTGACSGNFIVQKYIPSRGALSWANLSSPVVSTTVQDWDNELYFSYPYSFPTVVGNVLIYNETIADYVQVSPATTITPGLGFEIYLSDDVTLNTWSNTTINTIGVPTTGTQNINLNYTLASSPYQGQNLIGNPFASSIRVNGMSFTNALSTIDVYDNVSHSYVTLSGTDEMSSHQGFWAYSTSAGASVSIPETAKTTSLTGTIRKNEVVPFMQLTISSTDLMNEMAHTLKLATNENAKDGWDMQDHPFRKSPDHKAPYITANCEEFPLSISTFNSAHESYQMQLNTKVGITDEYQITVKGLEFINNVYSCVLLEDKVLGKVIDLTKEEKCVFKAGVADNQKRFVLHFSKSRDCKLTNTDIVGFNENSIQVLQSTNGALINFNLEEAVNATISVSNIIGQQLAETLSIDVQSQSVLMDIPSNFHGIYILKIESAKGVILKKFVKL